MNKAIPSGQFRACLKMIADGGGIFYKQLFSCNAREQMDEWIKNNEPFEHDLHVFTSVEIYTKN